MSRRRLSVSRCKHRAQGFALALSRLSRAIDAALVKRVGGALLATGVGLGLAAASDPAQATTFTITKLADTNDGVCDVDCSLREAVVAANANVGADVVDASNITGTITLSVTVNGFHFMEITDALTLVGPGADLLTVDADTDGNGTGDSRFFSVTNPNADFTLERLTLANGHTVGHGGAIYSSANLTLNGVAIQDARSDNWGGGISVANGDLNLTDSNVSGCVATTDGGGFYVTGGNATLADSSISGNRTAGGARGAGFFVRDGNVTLTNSTVSGNTHGGGFVVSGGDATLTDSTVSSNSTDFRGGGFRLITGNAMLTNSTVSGNVAASSDGGGFDVNVGDVTLINSTVSGNFASIRGGGFYLSNGDASLIQSTVSANLANYNGGGFGLSSGNATLTHSTVSGNTAGNIGGGFQVIASYGMVNLENSILANNTAIDSNTHEFRVFANTPPTVNYSLVEGTSAPAVTGASNVTGEDPMLGPLQNNGGPTFTQALLPGSPAIDAGDLAFVPPPDYDQRGGPFVRVYDGRLDLGAVEHQVVSDVIFADGFE